MTRRALIVLLLVVSGCISAHPGRTSRPGVVFTGDSAVDAVIVTGAIVGAVVTGMTEEPPAGPLCAHETPDPQHTCPDLSGPDPI
jgi:hypothetical protein